MSWVFDPHSGGVAIPADVRTSTAKRIEKYAAENFAGWYERLGIRFRGALCYIDAYLESEEPSDDQLKWSEFTREQWVERQRATPVHLCRLRYFAIDRWSFSFYTYSSGRYSPSMFMNGTFFGTPEEAFQHSSMYLREPPAAPATPA